MKIVKENSWVTETIEMVTWNVTALADREQTNHSLIFTFGKRYEEVVFNSLTCLLVDFIVSISLCSVILEMLVRFFLKQRFSIKIMVQCGVN